jgi:hypothetical protein
MVGLFMNHDMDAGWCNGSAVEIILAMYLGPSREVGVDAGSTKKIYCEDCLGKETAPEVEWKWWIGGAETCNEMVFEGADGSFGGVVAMNARGGQLEVYVGIVEKGFECCRGFVVKSLKTRFEAG